MLALAALWAFTWGCADPRTEPLAIQDAGYTETVVLWTEQATDAAHQVTANFTVADDLMEISTPGVDSPARLRLVVYIWPDCQILRAEKIMGTDIPFINDSTIIPALVGITARTSLMDSAQKSKIDSLERVLMAYARAMTLSFDSTRQDTVNFGITCDSPLYFPVARYGSGAPDTTGRMARFAQFDPEIVRWEEQIGNAILDSTLMGLLRDHLISVVDNRYALSFAIDDTAAFVYPNAVYGAGTGLLSGQRIYAAQTNPETGMKGYGIIIPLDRISAADPSNPGVPIQRNWAVCFPGSTQPCLDTGAHRIYVRMPGRAAKVSGSLVLVYAQRRL
jgi:hypothetical protein